jgi:hypothetical protein
VNALRCGGPHKPATDYRNFVTHSQNLLVRLVRR